MIDPDDHISATPSHPLHLLQSRRVIWFREEVTESMCLHPKLINSLIITLKLKGANQVISHSEEWNHGEKTRTSEDGFLYFMGREGG